jgi:hypothetical protein
MFFGILHWSWCLHMQICFLQTFQTPQKSHYTETEINAVLWHPLSLALATADC